MTEEQGDYLRMAGERIRAAKRVAVEAPLVRYAVSDLYYAMFHCATALLLTKGLHFSKHSAVVSGFAREFTLPGIMPQELHKNFHRAFDIRNECDYARRSDITEEDFEIMLTQAEEFILRTEAHLSNQP